MNTQKKYTAVVIDENGHIENIDDPGNDLLGPKSDTSKFHHISVLIPTLSKFQLFRKGEINPRLRFLTRIGQTFEVNKSSGGCLLCRLCLNVIERSGKRLVRIILRPENRSHFRAS